MDCSRPDLFATQHFSHHFDLVTGILLRAGSRRKSPSTLMFAPANFFERSTVFSLYFRSRDSVRFNPISNISARCARSNLEYRFPVNSNLVSALVNSRFFLYTFNSICSEVSKKVGDSTIVQTNQPQSFLQITCRLSTKPCDGETTKSFQLRVFAE